MGRRGERMPVGLGTRESGGRRGDFRIQLEHFLSCRAWYRLESTLSFLA